MLRVQWVITSGFPYILTVTVAMPSVRVSIGNLCLAKEVLNIFLSFFAISNTVSTSAKG